MLQSLCGWENPQLPHTEAVHQCKKTETLTTVKAEVRRFEENSFMKSKNIAHFLYCCTSLIQNNTSQYT